MLTESPHLKIGEQSISNSIPISCARSANSLLEERQTALNQKRHDFPGIYVSLVFSQHFPFTIVALFSFIFQSKIKQGQAFIPFCFFTILY